MSVVSGGFVDPALQEEEEWGEDAVEEEKDKKSCSHNICAINPPDVSIQLTDPYKKDTLGKFEFAICISKWVFCHFALI